MCDHTYIHNWCTLLSDAFFFLSGRLSQYGAPSCNYLKLMPELFPNVTKASLTSHQRLRGGQEYLYTQWNVVLDRAKGLVKYFRNHGDSESIKDPHEQA